ncbi:MAG: sigma-70 family RNA polymerase sigma factor [Gemmataceae bacterium]|nr:sigma-70 family RNA polymerase sigma factor [Gemmataceae bacterium]
MIETSFSLLDRLQQGPEDASWQRMVDIYTPLIRGWLRRYTVLNQDIDDLVQEVLAVVVRKLHEFERQPRIGAFRRWLRTITVNCLRNFWRAQRYQPKAGGNAGFGDVLDQLEDPESDLSRLWDKEHDDRVIQRLLELIRPYFEAKTWQAFTGVALQGRPVDQVAAELGMSANAVFIAKSRVLHQLRREGQDLLE